MREGKYTGRPTNSVYMNIWKGTKVLMLLNSAIRFERLWCDISVGLYRQIIMDKTYPLRKLVRYGFTY